MPVPIACPISLTPEEHARLESLGRAHSTPHALASRCRLILRTAAPDRPSNFQVATAMACERHTVGRWRQRYLAHGLNGLQDARRPRRVSPSERVEVLAMATRKPSTYHCPATRWSPRRRGRRARTASAAAPEPLQHLAHPGGGRPQAASERVLAQQPRS